MKIRSNDIGARIPGAPNMGKDMRKKSVFGKIARSAVAASALIAVASPANAALTINLTFIAGTSIAAQNAFTAAAARWTNAFTDNATLELTVGTGTLGAGILAQAGSARTSFSYSAFKTALAADATSATDATAVSNLAAGSSFGMLINRTSDNPNGAGSATAYLDNNGSANNSQVRITNANAKALGLTPTGSTIGGACAVACDAFIQFSNTLPFDFDPTNGINGGEYDFEGIATHEIGHALGFISGVDVLDGNSSATFFNSDQFTFVSSLDLFRFSAASTAQAGGVIDWTASTGAKYFSIDRGVTAGAGFSTGQIWGDGRQASHWKDNLGLGVMDPTAGLGETLTIGANDLKAFDAIGWNLRGAAVAAVPEPGTWMMMLAGFGLVGGTMRRRRSVQVASAI